MKLTVVIIVLLQLSSIAAFGEDLSFGISLAEFGTPAPATVSPFSSSAANEPNGMFYGSSSCKGSNCTLWAFPLTNYVTRSVAIFTSGPWRVAAGCQTDTWHACTTPKPSDKAWIELTKDGKNLRVIFWADKKPVDKTRAEKRMHSLRHWNADIWQIISVYNADTKETWPKMQTLQQELTK